MLLRANLVTLINTLIRSVVPLAIIPLLSYTYGADEVSVWIRLVFVVSLVVTFEQAVYPLVVRARIRGDGSTPGLVPVSLILGIASIPAVSFHLDLTVDIALSLLVILLLVTVSNHLKSIIEAEGKVVYIRWCELASSSLQIGFWTVGISMWKINVPALCVLGYVVYYSSMSVFLYFGQPDDWQQESERQKMNTVFGTAKLFLGQSASLIFVNVFYLQALDAIDRSVVDGSVQSDYFTFVYILRSVGYFALIPLYNSFRRVADGGFTSPFRYFAVRAFVVYSFCLTTLTLILAISPNEINLTERVGELDAAVLSVLGLLVLAERLYAIKNHIFCLTVKEATGRNYMVLLLAALLSAFFQVDFAVYSSFLVVSYILSYLVITMSAEKRN